MSNLQIHTACFILMSDLGAGFSEFLDLFSEASETADFHWGGNNRSLITIERMVKVIEDDLNTVLYQYVQDNPGLARRIHSLAAGTYVDLEN